MVSVNYYLPPVECKKKKKRKQETEKEESVSFLLLFWHGLISLFGCLPSAELVIAQSVPTALQISYTQSYGNLKRAINATKKREVITEKKHCNVFISVVFMDVYLGVYGEKVFACRPTGTGCSGSLFRSAMFSYGW